MTVQITLVDINPAMVKAWQATFEENPEITVVQGSMLDQNASAWVTPTNARGSMDGGLDAIIKQHLGGQIETKVQQEIGRLHNGWMPVGFATCVATGLPAPRFLISTPTMVGSSEDVSDTLNVALACSAAFQAVHMQNKREPGSVRSVALPGLGANTGRVPAEICADLMWTGYQLYCDEQFDDYLAMRKALEEQLGDLTPMTGATPKAPKLSTQPKANGTPGAPAPPAKDEDFDFDDAEE